VVRTRTKQKREQRFLRVPSRHVTLRNAALGSEATTAATERGFSLMRSLRSSRTTPSVGRMPTAKSKPSARTEFLKSVLSP